MLGVELPLLLALCLVLVNAFFVATEFAIVKVRSAHIEDLARRGSPLARVARKVINNLDTSLSAVQLGVTFASLGLGWIGEPTFARVIEPLLNLSGIWSTDGVHDFSFVLRFGSLTWLEMIS